VPVIVDAAAQLPPEENLWYFTKECGADVALFSGGKGLQGPQASGLVVGSKELIDAMRANASPLQRLARAMKVGKEEICGLVAAVERYVALDHGKIRRALTETVDEWVTSVDAIDGVTARRLDINEAGQPVPRLEVTLSADHAASDVIAALWNDDPRVTVLAGGDNNFFVTPDTLVPGEADLVLERLRTALRSSGKTKSQVGGV
jgi:L-seryl-tRNA(Ser) seleniumtransferase